MVMELCSFSARRGREASEVHPVYLSEPQNGAFSGDYQMTGSSISCGRSVGPIFRRGAMEMTLAEPLAL